MITFTLADNKSVISHNHPPWTAWEDGFLAVLVCYYIAVYNFAPSWCWSSGVPQLNYWDHLPATNFTGVSRTATKHSLTHLNFAGTAKNARENLERALACKYKRLALDSEKRIRSWASCFLYLAGLEEQAQTGQG